MHVGLYSAPTYFYWNDVKIMVYLQSISCHYASAEIEFIDVKGSIQEHMEKETRDMARKKILARGLNPESLKLKVRRTQLLVSYREMPSFSNRGPQKRRRRQLGQLFKI